VENNPGSGQNVLSRFTGSGQLTVDKVTYDQVTLSNLHSTVSLNNGVVTLKPLTAAVYNGRQSGTVVIDTRVHPATYTVDSKLENVDANEFLSSISSIKETIYGRLGADADLRFVTTAGSTNIVRSLSGRTSLHLKDGKIAHLDFLHGLATIGQFQRTADVMKPFTDVIQLTGDFDINSGVARTHNLKAVIPEGSLAAEGTIDLVQQALNLRLTAVLSKDYAEKLGGVTNVVGFLNTVLANRDGELVIPVILTGNIKTPQFAPDLQKVAQMKLENLVPNLQNPADWKNGIFGGIFRNTPRPNSQEKRESPQPGKTLQDLLDKVLRPRQP
jgi:AsmA protein